MKRTLTRWLLTAALLAGNSSGVAATVTVQGILRGEHTWTAENEYLLDGWIYVVDGAVLNIEPGTVVRGKEAATQPDYGALFICRGGKLNAMGTRLRPIIFTTESDDIADPFNIPLADEGGGGRGLWGGLILLGKGPLNRPDAEASGSGQNSDGSFYQLYEGLGDVTDPVTGQGLHRWGGNNNDDSSGALRFVSLRYSGKVMESNKEINGLSLAGVGRGTTVEFVEVYANADDGFEFWGGAVNTRYLVSAFNSDECFDMDQANNTFADPPLRQIDRGQNEVLDPRPQPGSPAFEGYKLPPADGYFIAAAYKGGFANVLWCQDWTALTDNGHLKPVAHALVCDRPAAAVGEGPTLSARLTENEFVLSFPSASGVKYQIQSRAAVGTGDWANEGAPLEGTGEVLTFREATGNTQKFYRVLLP